MLDKLSLRLKLKKRLLRLGPNSKSLSIVIKKKKRHLNNKLDDCRNSKQNKEANFFSCFLESFPSMIVGSQVLTLEVCTEFF